MVQRWQGYFGIDAEFSGIFRTAGRRVYAELSNTISNL